MNATLDLAEVSVRDAGHAGQLAQRQGRKPSLGPNERAQRLSPFDSPLDCHSVSVPSAAKRRVPPAFFAWMADPAERIVRRKEAPTRTARHARLSRGWSVASGTSPGRFAAGQEFVDQH